MLVETPIQKLSICKENNVYVKRDDLLPFSFGGNKVRIAYEYITDLKEKNCDALIGYGSSRSNLCRVLSNLCKQYNLPCYVVSPSESDGTRIQTSNSALVKACGANVIECEKTNVADTILSVIKKCENDGIKAYYINGDIHGKGNEAVPVEAYVKAYSEILNQSMRMAVDFDYIFTATGTGMTQAGLIAGKQVYGGKAKIIGISIARQAEKEKEVIDCFLKAYYRKKQISVIKEDDIIVEDDYVCGGYGKYNNEILKIIKDVMLDTGIPFDTTYTGKAFYGMEKYLQKYNIKNSNVLFIHTGGTPLFFDSIDEIMC